MTRIKVAEVVLSPKTLHEIRERLEFPRGVLSILQETQLFSPLVQAALQDLDYVLALLREEALGGDRISPGLSVS